MIRAAGYAAMGWMGLHLLALTAAAVGLWTPADSGAAWVSLLIAMVIGGIGWVLTGPDDEDDDVASPPVRKG